jgi:hypothetical protein
LIEWWKPERAITKPSSRLTVTQTGMSFACVRSMRLAEEPCQ